MYHSLIFDLDDTLLDTSRLLVPQAERESCLAMIEAGLNADIETCLRTRKELISQNLRGAIFDEIVTKIGVKKNTDSNDVARVGRKVFYEREVETTIYIEHSVLMLLERLILKYNLFLVTAGSVKTQNQKLEILKIKRFFKNIFFVDLEKCETKTKAFDLIRASSKGNNSQILSVGDRIDTDIALAKQLGMKTCWVVKGEYADLRPLSVAEQPDFKVNQITEIERVCQL